MSCYLSFFFVYFKLYTMNNQFPNMYVHTQPYSKSKKQKTNPVPIRKKIISLSIYSII